MRQWFISDLHLSDSTRSLNEGLAKLIASIPSDLDELYILGDLFDAWIGDDHGVESISDLEALLSTVGSKGTRLFVMHGNRDFLLGEAFAKRCNATLIDDPTVIATAIGPVLCAHGDAYCTDDHAHQAFRQLSRGDEWKAQVLSLPVAERMKLAASIRNESMQSNQTKDAEIMDVNSGAIIDALKTSATSIMIHGHTHKPYVHQVDDLRRVVLGDWTETGWMIELSDSIAELREFDLNDPSNILKTIQI